MLLEIIVILIFVLFAAIGMSDAAEWLMRIFSRSDLPCRLLAVVPVKEGDAPKIEARVRGILAEACWEAIGANCRVCLVDMGAGAEECVLCRRLSFAFDGVEYLKPNELCEKVSESLQKPDDDI